MNDKNNIKYYSFFIHFKLLSLKIIQLFLK